MSISFDGIGEVVATFLVEADCELEPGDVVCLTGDSRGGSGYQRRAVLRRGCDGGGGRLRGGPAGRAGCGALFGDGRARGGLGHAGGRRRGNVSRREGKWAELSGAVRG